MCVEGCQDRLALDVKQQILGDGHPDVAMTLNNLAVLLKATGKLAEAESLYARSLAIFRRALGEDHPKVAACRRNVQKLRMKISADVNSPASELVHAGANSSRRSAMSTRIL